MGKNNKNDNNKYENKQKTVIDLNKKIMTTGSNGTSKIIPLNNKQIAEILYGKKFKLRGKNKKQKELIKTIDENQITFAVGPSGVGKSFISIAKALELLANSNNQYQKIYIITPTVEADYSIGYLKGDLESKLDPYLFSTYYLIDKIIGKQNRKQLQELRIIEPLAYGFIRGISIDSAIVIAEESQNIGPSQMLNLLTRIGNNSKFLISGDLEQTDRKEKINGLRDGIERTKNIDDIGLVEFSINDIVRNPIISKILKNYN